MAALIECVPNFSEGRDRVVIEAIADAVRSVPGVKLLGVDSDKDYNRTVYTFAGEPQPVAEAAFGAAKTGLERIDMTRHKGEHPRLGALDVCPFIPLSGATMADCVRVAEEFGARLARELSVPAYLYEAAARSPERRNLANIRKGEYEGLAEKIADPAWKPDFGPARFVPRSGATVTGARFFLVAYNVNLDTKEVAVAQGIAETIRESGRLQRDAQGKKVLGPDGQPARVPGTLKSVKAMGVELTAHGITQVSMNLTDYRVCSMHEAFEEVRRLAAEQGVTLKGSELVGLAPREVLCMAGRYYLSRAGGSADAPEELLVSTAVRELGLDALAPFDPRERVIEYMVRP